MKIDEFRHIYNLVFHDDAGWTNWFFHNVATNPDCIYLQDSASTLLMTPYAMQYFGADIHTEYISCVATLPQARGKHLASKNIIRALHDARAKGAAMCELIPAGEHLFHFYRHLGFSTAFYVDRQHFTALHRFEGGSGGAVEPSYDIFSALERRQGNVILHSPEDYQHIIKDLQLDGEHYVTAAADDDGNAAILFATADTDRIKVKSLMADSNDVALTALADLRRQAGQRHVVLMRPPTSGIKSYLRPFGMARIINPEPMLEILAQSHPDLYLPLTINDPLLPQNNASYIINNGSVESGTAKKSQQLDITTLTSIIFSPHTTGSIFSIPSRRPYIALMLE